MKDVTLEEATNLRSYTEKYDYQGCGTSPMHDKDNMAVIDGRFLVQRRSCMRDCNWRGGADSIKNLKLLLCGLTDQ